MSKRRPPAEPIYPEGTWWCESEGCINRVSHTCESCKRGFCVSHLIEDIDAKVWYCGPCWEKLMLQRRFEVQADGSLRSIATYLREEKPRFHGGGSPTENIAVVPRMQTLTVRLVIQPRVLTARSVYVEEGGGILETPAGDVYLTKDQLDFLFTALP
jgi:hypothetical protein